MSFLFAMCSNAQSFQKGDFVLDAYYGAPNYFSIFSKVILKVIGANNITVQSKGPLGARFEYFFGDRFSAGLDFEISATVFRFYTDSTDNDGNKVEIPWLVESRKLSYVVTASYHFVQSEKVDFYGVAGLGYKSRTVRSITEDQKINDLKFKVGMNPFTFRVGLGMRLLFHPNAGFNFAIGGPQGGLINAGLTLRL